MVGKRLYLGDLILILRSIKFDEGIEIGILNKDHQLAVQQVHLAVLLTTVCPLAFVIFWSAGINPKTAPSVTAPTQAAKNVLFFIVVCLLFVL